MSTPSAPIVTALLAYGMSGKIFHAPFLATSSDFQLRGALERHTPGIENDYPGTRRYLTVEEVLADPAVELVVVNAPNNTHFDLARQALQASKHVLLEKPVATTPAELDELLALAQQQQRHLLAYQNRRWDSDFGAVRRVVESGQLGQLIEVHFRFDRHRPALGPKQFKEQPVAGSGLLYDIGPHLLDQALSLFGQPMGVSKALGSYRLGSQVDDFFALHLRYPQGLHVWLHSSLLVAAPGPAYVLHGTQGSYHKHRTDPQETQLQTGMAPTAPEYGREKDGQDGLLTLAQADGSLRTTPDPAPVGDYRQLFAAVYQTIRHGAAYPISAEELRWQLEVLAGPA